MVFQRFAHLFFLQLLILSPYAKAESFPYNGGPIVKNGTFYFIFLGSQWFVNPTLVQERNQLTNDIKKVVMGGFFSGFNEYGVQSGTLGGIYVLTDAFAPLPSYDFSSDINPTSVTPYVNQLFANAIWNTVGPLPLGNYPRDAFIQNLYVIFLPPGFQLPNDDGGYHKARFLNDQSYLTNTAIVA